MKIFLSIPVTPNVPGITQMEWNIKMDNNFNFQPQFYYFITFYRILNYVCL